MIEEVRLDDIITLQRGFDITEKVQKVGTIPVISSGGISSLHSEFKVKGPGVVIGRKGTLGKVFFTSDNYWPHDTSLWVKDFKGNDPKFIYYLLQVLHFEKFDAGAANPTLNRNHVHSLKLKVPKKEYRSKIASILSSYDELIENNKQRIKLLEQMAEEIYKEWFVRLRFPGYGTTKFFNEEGKEVPHETLEALPEGWEKVTLENIVKNIKKPFSEDRHSKLQILDLARMPRKSLYLPYLGDSEDLTTSRIIFEKNDILFGSIRPYFHKVSCPRKTGITNVSVIVLRVKNNTYKSFVLMTIFSDYFINWATAFSNGTKMPTISWNEVKTFKVNKPPNFLLKSFEEIIFPFIEEIQILSEKNKLLQETRDLLLPRLISGKLNIKHLVEEENLEMAEDTSLTYCEIK